MDPPVRIIIAKIGLDGHDRGAKLIVRNLRDAGMEVIYTGLWKTPLATVHAALQEDVDVLGISLLSAAHMTIMPEVVRLCREKGIAELPVIVGGIIPDEDKEPLRAAGVAGVFNPGTPMDTIIGTIRDLAQKRQAAEREDQSPTDIRSPAGLSRALSMVARNGIASLGAIPTADSAAIRIGVTGPPGVGKSTFIGRMARALRDKGRRVAVIAVDPSSPITGGSVLGDRLRMMSSEPDDGLFIRSFSTAGHAGGLTPYCDDSAKLLIAAGYDVVVFETVGAGQNDTEVRHIADEVLLLLMPGAGDSVQFVKAGIVEIATGFVVHKSDLPGSDTTVRELRDALDDQRPIWAVSSLRGEGLDPLCEWIDRHL